MKMTCCDDCPCLNHDVDYGEYCNLNYRVGYFRVVGAPYSECCSDNCKLKSIRHGKKEFIPRKVKVLPRVESKPLLPPSFMELDLQKQQLKQLKEMQKLYGKTG